MRERLLIVLILAIAACDRDDEILTTEPVTVPAPLAPPHRDLGGGVYEPVPGDPERNALLDAIRPKVVVALNEPAQLAVQVLRVKDGWAFAVLDPMRPGGGGPLTLAETALKDTGDGRGSLRTEAILRKTASGWRVQALAIGAPDVRREPHCSAAPRGLIPLCEATPTTR